MLLMKMAFDGEIPAGFSTLVEEVGARVLNAEPSHYTLEVTSSGPALDVFLDEAARFAEVFSVVRSGILAISLGGESIGHDLI
jgi:acetolactate synthase small subunit